MDMEKFDLNEKTETTASDSAAPVKSEGEEKKRMPATPPNADRKWRMIKEKMAHREKDIDRIVTSRKQAFLQGSPLDVGNDFRDMISVGYAMALEDNGLKDW